ELQLGFDTKQTLAAADQRSTKRHAYITGFDLFNDLIVITRVFELHLILKIKRCLGVVIGGEFHFITDVSDDIHLNVLVEIKRGDASLPFRDLWIFVLVDVQSEDQFGSSLWTDVDGISPENPVESLRFYLKL